MKHYYRTLITKIVVVTVVTVITFAASSTFAAKPTSIKFIEDIVVGDSIYSHYVVHCSNNKRKDISAWNNRKSWCVGKGLKSHCKKKQISAARKVCGGKKSN